MSSVSGLEGLLAQEVNPCHWLQPVSDLLDQVLIVSINEMVRRELC